MDIELKDDFKMNFKDGKLICVLNNNIENKMISLLCYNETIKSSNTDKYDFSKFISNDSGITQNDLKELNEKYPNIIVYGAIIRKNNFNELDEWQTNIMKIFESENTKLFHHNDIFYKYQLKNIEFLSDSEVELIYPIKNIEKLIKRQTIIVEETHDIYKEKIKTYIKNLPKNHKKFIDNILYHDKEEIILSYKPENNLKESFLITKDYKFIDSVKTGFYYLGIVFNDEIMSVRDLNSSHLKLLQNLLNSKKELEQIAKNELNKNGINRTVSLRTFIHYHPSFYHFHVHYVDTILNIDNNKINRAIDLQDIIQNIRIKDDYYQTVTLNIEVLVGSELQKLFE